MWTTGCGQRVILVCWSFNGRDNTDISVTRWRHEWDLISFLGDNKFVRDSIAVPWTSQTYQGPNRRFRDTDRVSGTTHMFLVFFLSFLSKRTCKGYHRSVKDAIKDLGRSLMLHYHHKLASALTKVTWKASQKGSGHYRKYMCPGLYQQIMPIT